MRHLLAWLALALVASALHAAPLRPKDEVLFMPGTARVLPDGQYELDVHAWLYHKSRIRGINSALARFLDIDLPTLTPSARGRFEERTGLFHTHSNDERFIGIVLDGTKHPLPLPRTEDNGRSNARVVVPASQVRSKDRFVRFHAWTSVGDARRFRGQALLVPPEGLSVVSDIDDTIKQTHVRNRHEMLLNTFARQFAPVPGMADRFRMMSAADSSTRFHYVSGSPIQLYPPLADFLRDGAFPPGSVHLRESTTWRSLLTTDATRSHKLSAIERLMEDFPRRRFLLIGDSGESDPETYAELARRHPERVVAVVIRDVTEESRDAPRYVSAFQDVDPARWHVLADGADWPELPR
ncbi:App1 family protein [Variovorax rhizosphaerae]|uniref:App1 family protein n=1 Tax=Variovorax rhizosphaerae TaxID=1836200 RepID=A0ABU8WMM7_9BURK